MWREKLESDIYFIPVRLEKCEVPEALAKFQCVDLLSENDFKWLLKGLKVGMERLGIVQVISLRSEPIENLSEESVKKMLQEKDFFQTDWYWMGKGLQHEYKETTRHNEKVIIDHTTGLTWQQSGSDQEGKIFKAIAQEYVRSLNEKKYAGYDDWRLPTLEEAMSLVEPVQNKEGLFISPVFDRAQVRIWTADKQSASRAWFVNFIYGSCYYGDIDNFSLNYVRAVR